MDAELACLHMWEGWGNEPIRHLLWNPFTAPPLKAQIKWQHDDNSQCSCKLDLSSPSAWEMWTILVWNIVVPSETVRYDTVIVLYLSTYIFGSVLLVLGFLVQNRCVSLGNSVVGSGGNTSRNVCSALYLKVHRLVLVSITSQTFTSYLEPRAFIPSAILHFSSRGRQSTHWRNALGTIMWYWISLGMI